MGKRGNMSLVSTRKRLARTVSTPAHKSPGKESSYTATEAYNEFGTILDRAVQGATVVITKHNAPRAVLISVEKFNALRQAPQLKLDALSAEFDDLLARMQRPTARSSMERAFNANPEQLGKAAVRAQKRG